MVYPEQFVDIIKFFKQNGFCKLPYKVDLTGAEEELERLSHVYHDSVYRENGDSIRHMQAIHEKRSPAYTPFFTKFGTDPEILKLMRKVVGSDKIYIHQSKINYKKAGKGLSWNWHQDYASYRPKDFLLENIQATYLVLLDDVDETNGPLNVVPRTHDYVLETFYDDRSAYPLLCTPDEVVTQEVQEKGVVSLTGKKGTTYIFHSCILHSSSDNKSDKDRKQLYFTYNSFENRPYKSEGRRNWWNSAHDWTPL